MPTLQEALPKYLQIANHYRDRILRGDLRPGDELPSERQITVDWNVSRPTATRALHALRIQGLVEARQGSGTYVRAVRLTSRARERYQRARETGRIYPPNQHAKIVSAALAVPPDFVADALDLAADATAVRRHRITYSNDVPIETSTSWYPAAVAEAAPRLLECERILEGTLAYVEASTGRRGAFARDQASARMATSKEREELGLRKSAPVLVVRHIVYDTNSTPIEFAEAIFPPERWTFEQEYLVGD